MRLSDFLLANIDTILKEWEESARTIGLEATGATDVDHTNLRNRAAQILRTAAAEMKGSQTEIQRSSIGKKDEGMESSSSSFNRDSILPCAGKLDDSFDLDKVLAEYRALRSIVLRLWRLSTPIADGNDINDIMRFSEVIDQSNLEAIRSWTGRVDSESKLEETYMAHAAALSELNRLGSRLWQMRSLEEGLQEMLTATISLLGADMGNIHLLDEGSGERTLQAQQGFKQEYINHFTQVSITDDSASSRTLRSGERTVIEDVESDERYAPFRTLARSSGYRAVQSTPLIGLDGKIMGMLSTHFKKPHRPSEHELRCLDLYARQASDFIERLRVEEKLLRSTQVLSTLVERSPFGVYIVDADFRIAHMNMTSQNNAFSNVRPVIGRRFDEAISVLWPQQVALQIIDAFRHTLNTGEAYYSKNFINPRADTNQVEGYEWELHRLTLHDGRSGVICYFFDSTELRRKEVALREAHDRTVSVLNSMSDCYIEMDEEFRLTFINQEAARLNGFRAEDVLGKTHWDIWPWCNGTKLEALYRRTMDEKQPAHFEFFYEPLRIWIQVHAYPMTKGLAIYFRDISDSKRVEREREQVLQAERAAREEAERVSRMKDEFLATLSHELRTPLNAILGWAQMLKRAGRSDKDYAQGMEVLEQSARAQAKLIDDLLDMSSIISGKIRLSVQRIELTDVINASISAVQPAADARGVHIEKVINSIGGPLYGDPTRLQQVLWNLLTNAVKFTPRGGNIRVVLKQVGRQAEICVTDSGKGIKSEFIPFVFDRFRQEDASTTRKFGGLGLGLSIVRNLVESHGGSVDVSSDGEGRGSTFSISLPLIVCLDGGWQEDSKTAQTTERFEDEVDGMPNLKGVKVLIVDDHPETLDLVRRMLGECQAAVVSASSAEEALNMIESEKPDVLVSDIGMPEMDGFELIRQVRQLPTGRGGDTPAAALTAFARSEDRHRALQAGFQSHIAKPVDHRELVTVIANLVGQVDLPLSKAQ